MFSWYFANPFQANISFLYPPEKYRNKTLRWTWLFLKKVYKIITTKAATTATAKNNILSLHMKTMFITEGFHLFQNAEATITVHKIDKKTGNPQKSYYGPFFSNISIFTSQNVFILASSYHIWNIYA